jgi:hypothetical protein
MWIISGGGRGAARRKLQREGRHRVVDHFGYILEVGVAQPIASSKDKEDIEWWIVPDVDNIGRGAWRSTSQAPKSSGLYLDIWLGAGLSMGFRKKGVRENFKIFVVLEQK